MSVCHYNCGIRHDVNYVTVVAAACALLLYL